MLCISFIDDEQGMGGGREKEGQRETQRQRERGDRTKNKQSKRERESGILCQDRKRLILKSVVRGVC